MKRKKVKVFAGMQGTTAPLRTVCRLNRQPPGEGGQGIFDEASNEDSTQIATAILTDVLVRQITGHDRDCASNSPLHPRVADTDIVDIANTPRPV